MRHVHPVKGSPYLHYIRVVPKDARPVIGKKKWRINLKSASRDAVKTQVDELTSKHSKEIEAARIASGKIDILAGLKPEERTAIEDSGGVHGYLEWLDGRALEAKGFRDRVETYLAKPEQKEFLHVKNDPFGVPEQDFEIDPEFVESEIAALDAGNRTIQRQLGRHVKTVARLNVAPGPHLASAIEEGLPDDAITLSGIFSKWVETMEPSSSEQYAYPVAMFESLHGPLPVNAITTDHIRAFRDLLPKVPTASGGKFKNMSMTAMIEAAERKGAPRLSNVTAQKYFRSIGTLLNFAVEENYLGSNPVGSLKWRAPKAKFHAVKKSRRSLSADEMRRLLDALPTWAGNDGIENAWFCRILAFTGCRPEELSQCAVSDVAKVDGVRCFRFHDAGLNKLKTESALRNVPVHPQLVALGLDEFLATRTGPIFESLKADGRGRIYSRMGSRLKRFMTNKVGLKDRKIKPYSLRDTFIDSLRLVECPAAIEDDIIGHSNPERKVASGYGEPQLVVAAKYVAKANPLDGRRTVKQRDDD